MHRRLTPPALAAMILLLPLPALAEVSHGTDTEELAVTVYNDNLGLIREVRRVELAAGVRELQYADVASGIDATSVALRSLEAPQDLRVLEQNYEYDLLTPSKLLDKFVGQEVEIQTESGPVKATLLSNQEGPIFRIGDRIHLQAPGRIILPRVPENLVTHPTLKWLLQNGHGGDQRVEVTYLTSGLSWHADYVLVLDPAQSRANLNGWVTLDNQSGASYPNATLTLVAGDVHRVREPGYAFPKAGFRGADAREGSPFAEKALFEYHSYRLQRPTTLKDRQTKQVSLLAASEIPVRKTFRFEAQGQPIWTQDASRIKRKVDVYVGFNNASKDHLGMPLPKGKLRVYQQDADQRLQFVGEDSLDHTPKDERVLIKVGQAFDLVGERRQTSYRVLGTNLYETSYEVSLRNHKDEPVTVAVAESLGGDWEVVAHSHAFTKTSTNTLEFAVPVGANQETQVTYTVRTRF